MRILMVCISGIFFLTGCSSGTTPVPPTTSFTGSGNNQSGNYNYGDSGYYDQNNFGDDLPGGVFPALFGWDGQDYNVFLGLVIETNNSYSACNPYTYGNAGRQDSIRNTYTFANPYSDIGAYNPRAQHPPTMWNYNTDTGYATFVGYVRKGAQIDPDVLCR